MWDKDSRSDQKSNGQAGQVIPFRSNPRQSQPTVKQTSRTRKIQYRPIERAEYNRVLTERMAERTLEAIERREAVTSDPEELRRLKVARVRAVRMQLCADPENVIIGEDYHIEGPKGLEYFDGHSRLNCCGSFLCVHHQARKRRRSRKRALEEIRSYPIAGRAFVLLLVALADRDDKTFEADPGIIRTLVSRVESYCMLTLTHTTLPGLRCVESINLVNRAFRRWRRTAWYEANIRGGVKAVEWTVPDFQPYDEDSFQYHTHAHLAAIITADISTRDKLIEFQTALRGDWTAAFLAECAASGLPAPEIKTAEGTFLCDVKSLYSKRGGDPLEDGLAEIIKYVTKPDVAFDLTDGQLIDVMGQERWPRQVEAFGCVYEAAKAVNAAERERRDAERAVSSLDTENITVQIEADPEGWESALQRIEAGVSVPGARVYRLEGRVESERLSRLEVDIGLTEAELRAKTALEFKARREFERYRLRHKFKYALFTTLGGDSFEGIERWRRVEQGREGAAAVA